MEHQAPRNTPKTAIIGGGVIGLGIGWRLAQAGCAVEIFERGEAGKGASWAAAGMLAAGVETEPGELGLHALNRASQLAWPAFAAELEAASGQSVELRREGTLDGGAQSRRRGAASLHLRFPARATASRSSG